MDEIIETKYFLFGKKIIYKEKTVKNNYFSKYLIIYKYYDYNHNILREKTVVYKNNPDVIFSKEEYYIDGVLKLNNKN